MLRRLLFFVAVWCGGAAHTWGQADFSHWRWWFLASTTDSATIALYDRIEHRYLHVSDLRVLREDLEPLYAKLSDTIVSESEAQTAALLIRLFHYSAARPYRTAQYVDRIVQSLLSYLQSPAAQSVPLEVGVDLYVAWDLGFGLLFDVDAYYEWRSSIDHGKMAAIIEARVRYGSADNLNRSRFLVQSLDGVTKCLDYNGVVDSSLVAVLTKMLGHQLDTLDLIRQPDLALTREWHLLLRYHLAVKARLYLYHMQHWKSEDALNAFSLETAGRDSLTPLCLPEARLRGAVISLQYERSSAEQYIEWANKSSSQSVISRIMLAESTFPGLSKMFDANVLGALVRQRPVRLSALNQLIEPINQSRIADSLAEAKNLYSTCFNSLFPDTRQNTNESSSSICLNEVLDNLMLDGNYTLRLMKIKYAEGQFREAANELLIYVKSASRNLGHLRPNMVLLQWADDCGIVNQLDRSGQLFFYSAYQAANWLRYRTLVTATNPWSTSAAQNVAKANINRAMRALDTLALDEYGLMRNVWIKLTQLRGAATSELRNKHTHSTDTLSAAWKQLTPLARIALSNIFEIVHHADMAGSIAGSRKLNAETLSNVQLISLCLNSYSRSDRELRSSHTHQASDDWMPAHKRIYITFNPYRDTRREDDDSVQAIERPYWSLTLLSSDTLMRAVDISDSIVVFSLYHKLAGIGYGLNTSTALDSIIMSLVSAHESRFGTAHTEVVFMPSGVLYAYNFFLVHANHSSLADSYDVLVTVRPSRYASNTTIPIETRFLMAGDVGLSNVDAEFRKIDSVLSEEGLSMELVAEPSNETEIAKHAPVADVFHVSSHAVQPDVYELIKRDSNMRELLAANDVGTMARRMWSPLIQYKSVTRDSGAMFGDGLMSPFEMELFAARFKNLVFLSTCQTATLTGDIWEPQDGIIRELFAQGAKCIVMSPVAVPDRYAPEYSSKFYKYLLKTNEPHKAATQIVREGMRTGASVFSYGLYFPIYFETR